MPRKRQQKVLAPVPEDEELVEDSPKEDSKSLDENVMQLIDALEQQGLLIALCTPSALQHSFWTFSCC